MNDRPFESTRLHTLVDSSLTGCIRVPFLTIHLLCIRVLPELRCSSYKQKHVEKSEWIHFAFNICAPTTPSLEFCYPFAIFDSKELTRKTNSHNNKKRVAGIARMCGYDRQKKDN